MMSMSGIDFVRKVDVYPVQLMDGDIKLVASYDISPSSFPNTRLELISNSYQLYRFNKCKITYTSLLPTAVNGLFLGYIDTDPSDQSVLDSVQTSNDVLRIARSHQGSKQGKIRDNWSFEMPIRDDDQMFFIGDGTNDNSDKRFRKMGTLYIFQIGQATKFDGSPLTEELSAGALNIEWSCTFMNPQLQSLTRVYDGVTEKDVYRVINDISWYRSYSQTSYSGQILPNTRFRHLTWTLQKDLFQEGIGDYVVLTLPIRFNISKAVKSVNSIALPYSQYKSVPYGITLWSAVTNFGTITTDEATTFLQNAFKFGKGAIEAARQVYDVVSLISSVFLLNAPDVVDLEYIDDPADPDINHSDESIPKGQCIIHYDGINSPIIEDWIEYESPTTAARPNSDFNITKLFVAFRIKRQNNDNSVDKVEPSVPYLRKF